MTNRESCVSSTVSCSESTWYSHLKCCHSICTISYEGTTLKALVNRSCVDLQFNCWSHWVSLRNKMWSIVIWNLKISSCASRTKVALRWSTLVAVPTKVSSSTPTSNRGTTVHQRSCSASGTVLPLTCGHLAASCTSSTWACHFSSVRMKKTKWTALLKSRACRPARWSWWRVDDRFSSTRTTSQFKAKTPKARYAKSPASLSKWWC